MPSLAILEYFSLDTITKTSFATSLDEIHSKYSDAFFLVENKKMMEAVTKKLKNVSLMTLANDISELSREKSLETVVYIGNTKSPKISAWCLQNQPKKFVSVSSDTFETEDNPVDVGRILMQRFYLIEKAKDAERVGIVLGSNGGHRTSGLCMDKLRKLGQEAGKTIYSLSTSNTCYSKINNEYSCWRADPAKACEFPRNGYFCTHCISRRIDTSSERLLQARFASMGIYDGVFG